MAIVSQYGVHLVEAHELGGSVLFGLAEGFEADVSRRFCCVCERTRDGVQIMSPDGDQASLPAHGMSVIFDFSIHTYNFTYSYVNVN